MDSALVMKMIFHLIGGLGIFLLGMNYMKEGLQYVAGATFKKVIGWMTANRFLAVGAGFLLTTLVQSSSITTVMVVGLVNSELMILKQAIGVIMGANIGTTITGWIIAIKIGKWGLPILGLGAFGTVFIKKEKLKYVAMAIMGIGMIFFGLTLMKNGFKPIRSMPTFEAWFHVFNATTYIGVLQCALVGCVLTFIVQSSSATLGITLSLAATGIIPFETAAALVLGENIGTTITAFLASLGTGIVAKRAAYFHIIFNILGVIWITAIFSIYVKFIESIVPGAANHMVMVGGEETFPNIAKHIALVHTGFNIANTLFFLPFVGFFSTWLNKIGTEKPKGEEDYRTHLDFHMFDAPHAALEQSKHEIVRMDEHIQVMLDNLKKLDDGNYEDSELREKVFKREDILDDVQKEITTFLTDLLAEQIPVDVAHEAQIQLRMADEYESVSDEVVRVLKLHLRLKENNVVLSENQSKELIELHDLVCTYYKFIHDASHSYNKEYMESSHNRSNAINNDIRELRKKHWERLSGNKVAPLISTTYMDIANSYRRIKDHLLNISESISGRKMIGG